MSLIPCLDDCVYQEEGRCTLSRAASSGRPGHPGCVNFIPKSHTGSDPTSQQGGQGLPDVGHPDELQSLGDDKLAVDPAGNDALGKAQPPHFG